MYYVLARLELREQCLFDRMVGSVEKPVNTAAVVSLTSEFSGQMLRCGSQNGHADARPLGTFRGQKGENRILQHLSHPDDRQGFELEMECESKTVVQWISGQAKQRTPMRTIEFAQKQMMDWWR